MNINFNNKRVIIRVDFNVPIKNGIIQNTLRIDKTIPTILRCLKDDPNRIIIISHLGRPNGKINLDLSLKILIPYLNKTLNQTIGFTTLDNVNKIDNKIILLENIRFYKEEESKELTKPVIEFRNKLTQLGDIFINDAFGCCHRNHSSIVGINCPIKIPGYLVSNEIKYLSTSINNGKKPKLAIIGGSKVNDKIKLLKNLITNVDDIIIGGGMAFTFLKYDGYQIGNSLFDSMGFDLVKNIYQSAKINNTKLHLPIDFKIGDNFKNDCNQKFIDIKDGITDKWMGLDIGPKTINNFNKIINKSQTIIWNGPMGVFEFENFQNGSLKIAEELVKVTNKGSITIIGGGDTSSCVSKFKLHNKYTHLSTGGGVSLKLLEGSELPGLLSLK